MRRPADRAEWQGRVDAAEGRAGRRWHQVVTSREPATAPIALLGFACDAGVVRNLAAPWDASPVEIAGRTFRDHAPKGNTLNVPQALAYSSNTVTMRIADELGEARLLAQRLE